MPTRRHLRTTPTSQYAYYGGTLAPTDQWWIGVYDTELEQRAVFGEVGFDVTENFTITAGGRWFEYDRKFELHQESPVGFERLLPHRRTSPTRTTADRWQAQPDLPNRRRPHGVCDLLGGIPERR